jgi:uncharacterized protein (UPF0548 family)
MKERAVRFRWLAACTFLAAQVSYGACTKERTSLHFELGRGGAATIQISSSTTGSRQINRKQRCRTVSTKTKSDVGWMGHFLLKHVTHKKSSCRTRFAWFGKPSDDKLHALFDDTARSPGFNHECVGMTHPIIHSSNHHHNEGDYDGNQCYESAVQRDAFATKAVDTKDCQAPATRSHNDMSLSSNREDCWIPDALSFCREKATRGDQKQQEQEWRTIRIRRTVGHGQECYEAVRDAILSWERTLPTDNDNKHVTTPASSSRQETHQLRSKPFWASVRLLNYSPVDDCGTRRGGRSCTSTSVASSDCASVHQIGGPCKKLVTISRSPIPLLNLWTYNPCQVIYDVVDERYVATGQNPLEQRAFGNGNGARHSHGQGLTYTSTAYATLQGHLLSGEERVSVALHDAPSSKVVVEVLSYSRPTKGPLGRLVFPLIKPMQERFFNDQVTTLEQLGQQRTHSSLHSTELTQLPTRDDHVMQSSLQQQGATLANANTPSSSPRAACIFAADKFVFGL